MQNNSYHPDVLIYCQNLESFFEEDMGLFEESKLGMTWQDLRPFIENIAQQNYEKYGQPVLDEEQFLQCIRNCEKLLVDESLISLVDKGLVEMAINENGNIVYKATDNGIQLAKKIVNKKNDNSLNQN